MISYEGVDEYELIHALYHGTAPLGMGMLHHTPELTVEDVKADLSKYSEPFNSYFDYYRGHPLKLRLDTSTKTFDERLYDRDTGAGKAQRIVDRLKGSRNAA